MYQLFILSDSMEIKHNSPCPISITPILSRLLEIFITRQYIYPCFDHPSVKPNLMDQFAFRPTAIIAITYLTTVVTSLLRTNRQVHFIALDFSKAFDTLNHFTLVNNLASLPLPDNIYITYYYHF